MIKLFIDQNEIDRNYLQYSAGTVNKRYNEWLICGEQMGAEKEMFSISQPVYDKDKNLMGYLGIGTFQHLDYSDHPHGISIPCYYWRACKPTQYCIEGKKVYTYWQNFNECVKGGTK